MGKVQFLAVPWSPAAFQTRVETGGVGHTADHGVLMARGVAHAASFHQLRPSVPGSAKRVDDKRVRRGVVGTQPHHGETQSRARAQQAEEPGQAHHRHETRAEEEPRAPSWRKGASIRRKNECVVERMGSPTLQTLPILRLLQP
jgi:hypothetical protein